MNNKRINKALLLALISTVFSTTAIASNCRGVKFNFANDLKAKIKIERVLVDGNGKRWSHDINNKVVFAGESFTTDKLRFDKLDAGASGTFTVRYKWFDANTGRWGGDKLHNATTIRCDNNMTIRFRFE